MGPATKTRFEVEVFARKNFNLEPTLQDNLFFWIALHKLIGGKLQMSF